MESEAQNLVIVLSDEHASKYLGCYGHPMVRTPNFDRFASEGARFSAAYTNCPICMPARASLATGLYPHQTGYWCNAMPYDGAPRSWGHRLQDEGISVTSIGKLHYKDGECDTGFDRQILPMHAVGGIGDLPGAIRHNSPLPPRTGGKSIVTNMGRGESEYTRYDRQITDQTVEFLTDAAKTSKAPWVLFVGLVAPHFPLIAPAEFFDLYPLDQVPMPKAYRPEDWPVHPWFDEFRKSFITDGFFDDEKRRMAIAAYFGLCSFVDHNFGRIVDCIDEVGLKDTTRVIYTSDHGDNLGARGLWQKSTFYEESAAVPLLMRGDGITPGSVVDTPVSLIDIYPTVLDSVGCEQEADDREGASLIGIAQAPYNDQRTVFAEYHAAGAISGAFMLRKGRYKYIHYVGYPAQLYDLVDDPEELDDLAGREDFCTVQSELEAELRERLNPEEVDRRAKSDQLALLNRHGGREAVLARGTYGATPPPSEVTANPK